LGFPERTDLNRQGAKNAKRDKPVFPFILGVFGALAVQIRSSTGG
jgi:hypothetical protein